MGISNASGGAVQIGVCLLITFLIGLATWATVRRASRSGDGSSKDVFLAGGGLTWPFVAGAITLTNLSTDQLVGMNGNQMLLLAWWELAGFVGLLILSFVFLPIYYRAQVTTVTELLEKRYGGGGIRTLVSALFLFGMILIYLPAGLYSGALFLRTLFGTDVPIIVFAAILGVVAAAYTITGGLRAVAVMETYAGVGVMATAVLIVVLALRAVGWDLTSGVPAERLTMIGAADSPIPFHTLFTGMIFIQIYYWSTNQPITQKAMAAPSLREARKGVLAAALVRICFIPAIVAVPGVVAYKLFGDIDDAAYGRLVGEVLPPWMSGAFAAMIAAAVIAHTSAVLNAAVGLYAVDFHDKYVAPVANHWRLAAVTSAVLTATSIALVPVFENAKSIINLLQQLNGLSSMPILSAFAVGLLFKGVESRAAIVGVIWGVILYGLYTFVLQPEGVVTMHYIDFMVVTLFSSIAAALLVNRLAFGGRASLRWREPVPAV
ncbi:sodium:solute symporter family transporter [Sphingomonas sp. SUN039]|uniref:sodium:solute symporter family transporter n=1 Tax=Sphingomonas sp. SUN039 TaxID=2937787 RepID=UPI002164E151|nr:sodium/solute symporter [Sphingomonas sp. SUN039]UVO52815.1 sodium/solute symporter [Sphingomonas sp. SUN039]